MFDVAAASYDRFMGRYSTQLSPQLADLAVVEAGQRVLDVGCGPGVLTGELAARVGASNVSATDPSAKFVAATRQRYPEVDVRQASAEELPFHDDIFDVSLAQLVVHFMNDPVEGLREMKRVTRPGGVVAACVWDFGGSRGPLSPFYEAARHVDPHVNDESERPGTHQGHLLELFELAGLANPEETTLTASIEHVIFEDWWEPFKLGVGTAGSYLSSLDLERQAQIEVIARDIISPLPFLLTSQAWAVRGSA
jgi:ubiquinone/menaquinone biosynthesis C-methylase UbiE